MIVNCFDGDDIPKDRIFGILDVLIKKHEMDIEELKSDMDKALYNTTQKLREIEDINPSEIH